MQSKDFVSKLVQMLKGGHRAIQWNDQGTQFHILDLNDFKTNVLPFYFRHDRYDSFVRQVKSSFRVQLNMYGFHKISRRKAELIFHHEYFIKGKEENYNLVRRKTKNQKQGITNPSALGKLNQELKQLDPIEPNFVELFQRLLDFKQNTNTNNKTLRNKLDQMLRTVSSKKNKVIKPMISSIKEYIGDMDTSYRGISELINSSFSQNDEKCHQKILKIYSPLVKHKIQERGNSEKMKFREQNKHESSGRPSQLDTYLFPELNPSMKSIGGYID